MSILVVNDVLYVANLGDSKVKSVALSAKKRNNPMATTKRFTPLLLRRYCVDVLMMENMALCRLQRIIPQHRSVYTVNSFVYDLYKYDITEKLYNILSNMVFLFQYEERLRIQKSGGNVRSVHPTRSSL